MARGTPGLIAPTQVDRASRSRTHTIDGIEIVFQLAPETEAPAEMHMFYPAARRAQHGGECLSAAAQLHPAARRGGARSAHLGEVHRRRHRDLYGPTHRDPDRPASLAGLGHGDAIVDYLEAQRDLYKHIHDQTLRYMNKGWRPAEIAEAIDLPPGLAERWSVRGYYGTVSHNVKAVYQRYLSWYDGNPVQSPSAAAGAGGAASSSSTWAVPRR